MQEIICFELKTGDETCNFLFLYRSLSQSQDYIETFKGNLELNLEYLVQRNPFLIVAVRELNAKSRNWFCHEITSFEGDAIKNLTPQFGLHQVIKEPTQFLDILSSSNNLILTSQPKLIIESGAHWSLHSNCHHQINISKFSLEAVYPPPFVGEVWHYKDANTDLTRQVINKFN